MIAACPAAETGICTCADCARVRLVARLREGAAKALHCPAERVRVALWQRATDARHVADVDAGDLSVSYRARSPEDAAQGVLSALDGTLDLG